MTTTQRWIRFAAVGVLGMALQLAIIGVLANRWNVDYLVATGVGVLAAIVHNFAWHRRWTWSDRRDSRGIVGTFAAFSAATGAVSLAGNLVVMRILVGGLHVPTIAANLAAIAVCAAANYIVADRRVFATG